MKKILKPIVVVAILLSITTANAHQPDISSVTLIEQESGQWTMQINASMTAFQYEVWNAYGKDSYATPAEFNQLLLSHLREKIELKVNGGAVILGDGFVKLGHATAVVFNLSEIPKLIEDVSLANFGFKTIHHSQSVFSIVKEGLDNSQFVLSEANDYQLNVKMKDNQVLVSETSSTDYQMVVIVIAMFIGLFAIFLFRSSGRKPSLQPTSILSHT